MKTIRIKSIRPFSARGKAFFMPASGLPENDAQQIVNHHQLDELRQH